MLSGRREESRRHAVESELKFLAGLFPGIFQPRAWKLSPREFGPQVHIRQWILPSRTFGFLARQLLNLLVSAYCLAGNAKVGRNGRVT